MSGLLKNGRQLVLALGVLLLPGLGCDSQAFCYDCQTEQEAGGGASGQTNSAHSGGTGNGTTISFAGTTGEDAGQAGTDGCGDTDTDPRNCGTCGHVCSIPGAFPDCVDGVCVMADCADGFVDEDGEASNGCECELSGGGRELCDNEDNDCDGLIDEDFDLENDVENCGACNNPCPDLPHSSVDCVSGRCEYTCDNGFVNLSHSSTAGCTYECPVYPPVEEVCNGIDDDCDGAVDDGEPGAGASCQDQCPDGDCRGECSAGQTICSSQDQGLVCVGGQGPLPEICDHKDNDCDGEIDEDTDFSSDPLNCGDCGIACAAGDVCDGGNCQFTCAEGTKDIDGLPGNRCEYACPRWPVAEETCNGIDDDCDGVIDDHLGDTGAACSDGCPNGECQGACTEGEIQCVGGALVCRGGTLPSFETCNGIDDDCDGTVDNGFDTDNSTLNCGSCGHVCTLDNAVAGCAAGKCTIVVCQPGFSNLDGNPDNGCEHTCEVYPTSAEVCNGVDDDCDGEVDEASDIDPKKPAISCSQNGPCAGSVLTCQGQLGWRCDYAAIDDRIEVQADGQLTTNESLCDGFDNDCDGRVDEPFKSLGQVCSDGNEGACRDQGLIVCDPSDHTKTMCDLSLPPDPVGSSAEVCNGIDDDCNGLIDDDIQFSMVPIPSASNPVVWVDPFEASHPDATPNDPGIDGSIACSAGSVVPWTGATWDIAAAACEARGPGYRLCSASELRQACEGSSGNLYPYGNSYQATTCNGNDYDPDPGTPSVNEDALLTTGELIGCVTATSIFDLSGNAAEWTSTLKGTTSGTTSYDIYELFGGSYLSPSGGLSCDIPLVPRASENAVLDNIGFRCCRNP